ncbi:unnamed protein product [Mytilus coruscus]|uniref:Uncharacterized protein n=1 Tax=Mytilus coruscus TaxID=42192 RepID=A0A6J8AR11_MYTCO|nr:unnamed protein product [Mytilus coruscus]
MDNIQSFCGVSDSLRHDPQAIWAYLIPVLRDMKEKYPGIDFLHFYSDGPTAQYRQKINFYLLSTLIFDLGFSGGCWNFHEAGHADHYDTVEDFPEIFTQENFDNDQHDAKRTDQGDQLHQLRNCTTFEDVQLLFPRSTTETLIIDEQSIDLFHDDLSNDNIYLVGLSSDAKKHKDDVNDTERIEVVMDDDDLTKKQVKNDNDTATQMRQLRNCDTFAEVQTLCSELLTASSLDGKDRYVWMIDCLLMSPQLTCILMMYQMTQTTSLSV